jgi:hypothetical protein
MLVYTTEFPTRPGTTIEDFFSVCQNWLAGSPHYPFKALSQIVVPSDELSDYSRDGHQLHVAVINEEARRRAGLRHSWTEAARQIWASEIIASEDADGLWISVSLTCEMLIPGAKPPVPRKPYVIKQLFSELGGGDGC